jgi:hypothetical protein
VATEHHRILARVARGDEGGAQNGSRSHQARSHAVTAARRRDEERVEPTAAEARNLVDALHEELEDLRRELAAMPPARPGDEDEDEHEVSDDGDEQTAEGAEVAEAVVLGRLSGMLEWLTEDFANGVAGALHDPEPGEDRGRLLRQVRADLRKGLRRLEAALEQSGD